MSKKANKKGKRNNATVMTLGSFLDCDQSQVTKNVLDVDEEGYVVQDMTFELPTAPKAHRLQDDESIPKVGPFVVCINNLAFEADEMDIRDYFKSVTLVDVRLPRDDGGRAKGFCYIELATREDLISVLSIPDPVIKGRRVRIELPQKNEQGGSYSNDRYGGNRRYDNSGFSNGRDRDRMDSSDSGNWRSKSDNQPASRPSFNRDQYATSRTEGNDSTSNWRTSRPSSRNDSSSNRFPEKDEEEGRSSNGNWRTNRQQPDRDPQARRGVQMRTDLDEERPKLNLLPRTLPLPKAAAAVADNDSDEDTGAAGNAEKIDEEISAE